MNILQVIYHGMLDKPFAEIKNQRRFDNFLTNLKLSAGTLLVTSILISAFFFSPYPYEYLRDRNKEKTYVEIGMQKAVDFIKGKTIVYKSY